MITRPTRSLSLVLLAACGGPPEQAAESPVQETQPWRVGEQPLAEIGDVLHGEEPYLFEVILGGAVFPDGRFALLDGGSRIRFYDVAGRHERTVGRAGYGPGEFLGASRVVWTPGDTLLIYDEQRRTMTRLDSRGGLVGSRLVDGRSVLEPNEVGEFSVTLVPDGRLVTGGMRRDLPMTAPFDSVRLVLHGDGRETVELGTFRHTARAQRKNGSWGRVHGSPRLLVSAGGEAIAVAHSSEPRIWLFTLEGRSSGEITWEQAPQPVSRRERERHAELNCRMNNQPPDCVDSFLTAPFASHWPVISTMLWDAGGLLWVKSYGGPDAGMPSWRVYGPDGGPVHHASMPHAIAIGIDHVLQSSIDSLGVHSARLLELHRTH